MSLRTELKTYRLVILVAAVVLTIAVVFGLGPEAGVPKTTKESVSQIERVNAQARKEFAKAGRCPEDAVWFQKKICMAADDWDVGTTLRKAADGMLETCPTGKAMVWIEDRADGKNVYGGCR